jgi:hypothetical protein
LTDHKHHDDEQSTPPITSHLRLTAPPISPHGRSCETAARRFLFRRLQPRYQPQKRQLFIHGRATGSLSAFGQFHANDSAISSIAAGR